MKYVVFVMFRIFDIGCRGHGMLYLCHFPLGIEVRLVLWCGICGFTE